VLAGYRVISQDLKLTPEHISVKFSPSIYKKEATITYRRCPSCEWQERIFTPKTTYRVNSSKVNFKELKKAVKSYKLNPPSEKYRIYIAIDKRNNEIFAIDWDITELRQ
jgi:hypothetical protein